MRLKKITPFILSAVLMTGCSANRQVHDRNYLRTLFIDGDKAVMLFYSQDSEASEVHGKSADELKKAAELGSGRELFTGHTELVVLGDCNYRETLEALFNDWKVSPSCLTVCGNGDFMASAENCDGEELAEMVRMAVKYGKAPDCGIVTVLSGLLSRDGRADIPETDGESIVGTCTITK